MAVDTHNDPAARSHSALRPTNPFPHRGNVRHGSGEALLPQLDARHADAQGAADTPPGTDVDAVNVNVAKASVRAT